MKKNSPRVDKESRTQALEEEILEATHALAQVVRERDEERRKHEETRRVLSRERRMGDEKTKIVQKLAEQVVCEIVTGHEGHVQTRRKEEPREPNPPSMLLSHAVFMDVINVDVLEPGDLVFF